ISDDQDCVISDDRSQKLYVLAQAPGILAYSEGVFIKCKAERNEFIEAVKKRIQLGESNAQQLASLVEPKWQNKYDLLLSEELLCYDYASRNIDTKAALAFWHDLSDSFLNRITS
ncbi:MAG: hypothetical protein KAS17_09800, partial [Victivallaceae bacterium]|nr:hypothetical protein [Victivallaceae bacterium]